MTANGYPLRTRPDVRVHLPVGDRLLHVIDKWDWTVAELARNLVAATHMASTTGIRTYAEAVAARTAPPGGDPRVGPVTEAAATVDALLVRLGDARAFLDDLLTAAPTTSTAPGDAAPAAANPLLYPETGYTDEPEPDPVSYLDWTAPAPDTTGNPATTESA